MKKKIFMPLLVAGIVFSLAACGETDNTPELKQYKESMTAFFDQLEEINASINEIDPDDQSSLDLLYEQFDELEEQFKILADISVPSEYVYNEELADEAYDYMIEANDYLHQSYSDSSFNQNTLDAAMECYRRANKRVQYIIDILHGELPQDDNVTITYGSEQ